MGEIIEDSVNIRPNRTMFTQRQRPHKSNLPTKPNECIHKKGTDNLYKCTASKKS